MQHKQPMTDPQWRDFIVQRLDDGDRRFGLLEEGQKAMHEEIGKNTKITENALAVAEHTERKVDALIVDTHRIADERHKENIAQIAAVATNALAAKTSAEKTQTDIAGLLAFYDGGKAGVKVVKGIAVGIKGIVIYAAGVCVGVSLITAAVLSMMGKGPVPALFGH